jgi:tetratricopeptide (TPR) repeat protein
MDVKDCVWSFPQERLEGYFRHEWMLATERRHHMAEQKAFLVPVVIDGTSDRDAIVPDLFRAVQWTRLPGGETPPSFVERVQRLLSGEVSKAVRGEPSLTDRAPVRSKRVRPVAAAGVIAVALLVLGFVGLERLRGPRLGVQGESIAVLPPGEHAAAQSERPPGGSLEAYNAFLQGRFYGARNTEADERKAIGFFTQATQLDPRYAFAWSNLSLTWTNLGGYLHGAPSQAAYAKARAAADRALALSPDLAAAHLARGLLLEFADFDWRGAEAEFRRATALAPNDGGAKFLLGNQLAIFGEVKPAIALTQAALATDPLQAGWYYWLALARQISADRGAADAALKTLIDKWASGAPYQIAQVYALRHDAKETFAWLDRAWSSHDSGVLYLLYDPFILRYKDDPRFAAFCKKVGLPISQRSSVALVPQDHLPGLL